LQRSDPACHVEHGYSLSAIGQALGLRYSTISRIVNREAGIVLAQDKI